MRVIIYLSENNKDTISTDFGKTNHFHGNEMHFLKNPIRYVFQEPVYIRKSTYSWFVENIGVKDKAILNNLFSRFENPIILKDQFFINSEKEAIFKGNIKYYIEVEIQGFKKQSFMGPDANAKGPTPIWKILTKKI